MGSRFVRSILHGKWRMPNPQRSDIYLTFLGSLPELVRDGENGLVFKSAGELAGQLEVSCKK